MRGLRRCTQYAALVAATAVWAGASASTAAVNVLANPGFEVPDASGGDVFMTAGNSSWNGFNAAFATTGTKRTGNQSGKTFGAPGGMFQDFNTTPGTEWVGTVYGENFSPDPMTGTQAGFMNIEWHTGTAAAPGGQISFDSVLVVSSTSPTDQWIQGTIDKFAPPGATVARIVLLSGPFNGAGNGGGATFFDDATFDPVVPEPATLGVTAGVVALETMRRRRK